MGMHRRDDKIAGQPIRFEQAFDDPDAVIRFIRATAPYQLMAKVHNFSDHLYAALGPQFRFHWAKNGEIHAPGVEPFLNNQRFIDASGTLFRAPVVIPWAMMCNLTCPIATGITHTDLPTFAVATGAVVPDWLRAVMGFSGLFQEWAVPVSSAISWFYRGQGGEFEYWPDGLERAAVVERPPYWNTALVSDNDYMYHRVRSHADPAKYAAMKFGHDTLLQAEGADDWQVIDRDTTVAKLGRDEVRLSILWKALAFPSEQEAARYFDGSSDLDGYHIADIFRADMAARGAKSDRPADALGDKAWQALLEQTYTRSTMQ